MADNMLSRRKALRKLGLGVFAAYCAPTVLTVSSAAAASHNSTPSGSSGTSSSSGSSGSNTASNPSSSNSDPSAGSGASAPEASLPSGPESQSVLSNDQCNVRLSRDGQATISNSDFRRAQRAVRSGNALPLNEVLQSVQSQINGQLIEVRFSNSGLSAVYQFRMVSASGKLINVVTDASSAEILQIVNC